MVRKAYYMVGSDVEFGFVEGNIVAKASLGRSRNVAPFGAKKGQRLVVLYNPRISGTRRVYVPKGKLMTLTMVKRKLKSIKR